MADQPLLDRLRAGDEQAFDALFRQWYPSVVRSADLIVRDLETAEEIAQEVMLELWRRREQLSEDHGSVAAYLARSARNRALNHLRHRRVVERVEPDVVASIAPAPMPDAIALGAELEAVIATAIDELPPRCREVFELSRIHGLRYQEIATGLGISVKGVEAQMGRALRMLRDRLDPWLTG